MPAIWNPAVVSREVRITSREARAGGLEDSGGCAGCFCRPGGFPAALPAWEDSSVNNNYDLLFWRVLRDLTSGEMLTYIYTHISIHIHIHIHIRMHMNVFC